MIILLTGGLGYIGSHTAVELIEQGHQVVIMDNLRNSSPLMLKQIQLITGVLPVFFQGDVRNRSTIDEVLSIYQPEAIIHFAGLKAVEESVSKPLDYYETNVLGLILLLQAIKRTSIRKFIFSSSATIYGNNTSPLTEDMVVSTTTNPYGTTKIMSEQILKDLSTSDPTFAIGMLRYFNPVGAHKSGLIGELPSERASNLFPIVCQTINKTRSQIIVFGTDYPTPDGSCQRDFIHITDLAKGHIKMLDKLNPGLHIYNLGTGQPHSVLEVIEEFNKQLGYHLPVVLGQRRSGDIAVSFADVSKANKDLEWKSQYNLSDMVHDTLNWNVSFF